MSRFVDIVKSIGFAALLFVPFVIVGTIELHMM